MDRRNIVKDCQELYSGQIWLGNEYKKTAVDCKGDSKYIVHMTKPGSNRHEEIHEKTLEDKNFFGASRT